MSVKSLKMFAAILCTYILTAAPVLANVGCAMSCADNSPGSSCMSSCTAWSGEGTNSSSDERAAKKYGAIALSPSTLLWGQAYDFTTRQAAEEAALTYCFSNSGNPKDCAIQVWFQNACGSLALKPDSGKRDGAWGSAWGASRKTSEKAALHNCRKIAPEGCKIVKTICSGK